MSVSDECYTPATWLRVARDVLGTIDLDPASNADAQRVVKARRFFTITDNGLEQQWAGRVWMNPPYSRPGPWVSKLLAAYNAGDVVAAVALLNARTGSAWFRKLAAHAWRCEKSQRIRFYGPGTTAGGTGRMDSCFFYLGSEPQRFSAAFAEFGHIVPPAVTQAVTSGRGCVVCGRSLAGLRGDADTCSPKCRQRRYRLRTANVAIDRVHGVCGSCGLELKGPAESRHNGHCGGCNAPVFGDPPFCVKCGQSFGASARAGVQLGK